MSHDVQIKQFELSELESLLSFLRIAYANEPRKSDPAFWKWLYLENPYTSPDNIPLWIVKDADRVVGQIGAFHVELNVVEETRRAIWILDLVVFPEYRGQKLGKRLLMLARESNPTILALGFNDQSGRVLRSLDFVAMGSVHRYQRLLYPGHALKEISSFAPLRELANLGYAPFRPHLADASPNQTYTVREIAEFDHSFDDLWQRACRQWPCGVVRGMKLLRWQFRQQPLKKFDVVGLYENHLLIGYVVLFFRKESAGVSSKAAISDLCYDARNADDVIDALLNAALWRALERRAGSLVTDVRDPRVEARLRSLGFWRIKASPGFMAYSPSKQDVMYEPDNWFLTRADCDVSIFEEPNI